MSDVAAWYIAGAITLWAIGFAAGVTHANINKLLDSSR